MGITVAPPEAGVAACCPGPAPPAGWDGGAAEAAGACGAPPPAPPPAAAPAPACREVGRGNTCATDSAWLDATGRAVTPRSVTALCEVIGALADPYAEVPEGVYKVAPGEIAGGLGETGGSGAPHTGTMVCVG